MPGVSALMGLVKQGIKAVPQTNYALGVVGVFAAAVIVQQIINKDFESALPVFLIMLGCMFLLFVFAAFVSIGGLAVKALLWFLIVAVMAIGALLVSAAFFDKPKAFPALLCDVANVRCATVPPDALPDAGGFSKDRAGDILRAFWLAPTCQRVNLENAATLRAWMTRNGVPSISIPLFLRADTLKEARAKAVRELNLSKTCEAR